MADMADKLLKRGDKSWIKSFYSFIAIDGFLLNEKTEGKLSKNIYFPIRFTAWTCLKNAFIQKNTNFSCRKTICSLQHLLKQF
jgi:hypothetical protein